MLDSKTRPWLTAPRALIARTVARRSVTGSLTSISAWVFRGWGTGKYKAIIARGAVGDVAKGAREPA